MSDTRCYNLKNSTNNHDNSPLIRIALLIDCNYGSIDVLNSLINSLGMPYIFSFHDKLGQYVDGKWNGVIGEVVNNNSDIGAAYFVTTFQRYKVVDFAPLLGYGSAISILSGRIHANTGNAFYIFNSFTANIWLIFGFMLIIVAIFEQLLHLNTRFSLFAFIFKILSSTYYLLITFLNQNSQKYSRICCSKHLILNSMTLISIFLMTLFFNSEILSKILNDLELYIDSFDDLAQLLAKHDEVSLISDNETITWTLIKTWEDDQVQRPIPKNDKCAHDRHSITSRFIVESQLLFHSMTLAI